MRPTTYRCALAALLPLIIVAAIRLDAATVVRYAGDTALLAERWKWAADKARTTQPGEGYWIVYSFMKTMPRNSFIGSYNTRTGQIQQSLSEILCGIKPDKTDLPEFSRNCEGTFEGNFTINGNGEDSTPIEKEIAVLYHFDRTSSHELAKVRCSTMALPVAFGNETIYWLGRASVAESFGKLSNLWKNPEGTPARKDLLTAAGLHPVTGEQTTFLASVIAGSSEAGLRADAAFWLGEAGSHEAPGILKHILQSDPSNDVRKKALFALSEMEDSAATGILIDCARTSDRIDLRKEAIFWIGQQAAGKSADVLKSIVDADPELEVRKSALFALSQINGDSGIESLILIARKHPDREIRKEAIFMLSQSDDPRAIDALIAIVRP